MHRTKALPGLVLLALLALLGCAAAAAPQQRALQAPRSVSSDASPQAAPDSAREPDPPALPIVAPVLEVAQVELRSRVGPYGARSAAWIPGQPIAVNREFDFGTALATEEGAGIAAARRRNDNAALAEQLAGLEPIDPGATMRKACIQQRAACAALAGKHVRAYGLLFGERDARLRVVLELGDEQPLYASISDASPIDRFAEPGVLEETFRTELARALMLSARPEASASADRARCAAGDRSTVKGAVVARDAERATLIADKPRPTIVSCALSSLSTRGPEAPGLP